MNYEHYILWAASIYAAVDFLKRLARANGVANHPVYVRALPLVPAVLGAVSGYFVGPGILGTTPGTGAFFGVGAAAVAALSHSVHRQTIRGKDKRLTASEAPDGD